MLFGLVGKHLKHSKSAELFTDYFQNKHQYYLFELNHIQLLPQLFEQFPDLKGFNVTIPFKESIIPFLNEIDYEAEKIGAVNTIKVLKKNEQSFYLKGYNTDYLGFLYAYKEVLQLEHRLAIILGTGGASRAVAYALEQLKIPFIYVSRTKTNNKTLIYQQLSKMTLRASLIINTTPVGMFPNVDDKLFLPNSLFINKSVAIDLIYNPSMTTFMKMAIENGCKAYNGYDMLKYQAIESWKIWELL